jgi:hypothetical protein
LNKKSSFRKWKRFFTKKDLYLNNKLIPYKHYYYWISQFWNKRRIRKLKKYVFRKSSLFYDLEESSSLFKKVVLKFYYLNLLFKNNWFFFFKFEDFFFKDLIFLEHIFSFDYSYFSFNSFSFFFNNLNYFSVFLKNVAILSKNRVRGLKNNTKFFVLFNKGLFFFFKSYEKFLFFNSNWVWFYCFKSGLLKKRNIFMWARVKSLALDFQMDSKKFLNPLKAYINVLGGDSFSKLNFFRSKVKLYIFNKKIIFLNIFKKIFKLINPSFSFSFNNINFFSGSSFFYGDFFFFKVNEGFLKFSVPKKKKLIVNRFFSLRKALKNKLALKNNSFFINFLNRYLRFFSRNLFVFNKKSFVIFRSFKFICKFLVKKYKFSKSLVFLKYVVINSLKKWVLYLNGHRYYWDNNSRQWVYEKKNEKKYYYSLPFFLNNYFLPKVNILKFKSKIVSIKRVNVFFKFGLFFRWSKSFFFNRMHSFFIAAKRRIGFLRLWDLGLYKKMLIKFPFLSFQQNFGQKYFFSLKFFFLKSFFFRPVPYYFFRVNVCLNRFLFKNIVAFKDFFLNF